MKQKGLIHIYTGDGKGKTTSSLGIAMRAKGQGLRVCYVHFHKDPERWNYGEYRILGQIGIDTFSFAKSHPFCNKNSSENIRKGCLQGLDFIKKLYNENKYDILILDEINISVRDGFLKEEEVLEILKTKPENLEIILTGRGATERMIENADYVSEIKEIKHPYSLGIKRRKGIEY